MPLAPSFLTLAVVLVAVCFAQEAQEAEPYDFTAFKTQIANDLLGLENRFHGRQNEVMEMVQAKVMQDVNKLKTSMESLTTSLGDSERTRQQLSKIQSELTATKEKLDKTNEKIRLLHAENVNLKKKLESLHALFLSSAWKTWSDYFAGLWLSVSSMSFKFADVAKASAIQFSEFAQSKSVWLVDQWNYLYDKYFQYAVPFAVIASEKVAAWAQETHQKWRPTLDQYISKIHVLVRQHPLLSVYELEKYITVETVTAFAVVVFTVLLRLLLPLYVLFGFCFLWVLTSSSCCQSKKRVIKSAQNPAKY